MPVWYWIFTSLRTVKLQIYGLDKYLTKKKHGSETSNVYPSDKYQKGRILVSEV